MRSSAALLAALLLSPLPYLLAADAARISPEQLQNYLRQYPDADANKDGVLSLEEARAYLRAMRQGKTSPAAASAAAAAPFAPTRADVAYGPHARNVLDFWQAKSAQPTPVVVFIHGGGFTSGDKSKAGGAATIQPYLDAGVSFAAINYRYRTTAPIQDVLRDCARAIQFIRSRASEWNVDRSRLAAYGGSAGAGTSLWLAFHDDLADPTHVDPVLRESSRIVCAGANSTQFTYDLLRWPALLGEENARRFGEGTDTPGFYGLKSEAELRGPLGQKIRADCDMLGLLTKDDAPVFLATTRDAGPMKDRGDFLHHPLHAKAIYDRCRELGVPVVADLPGLGIKPPAGSPAKLRDFLLQYLQPSTVTR